MQMRLTMRARCAVPHCYMLPLCCAPPGVFLAVIVVFVFGEVIRVCLVAWRLAKGMRRAWQQRRQRRMERRREQREGGLPSPGQQLHEGAQQGCGPRLGWPWGRRQRERGRVAHRSSSLRQVRVQVPPDHAHE